MKRAPRFKTGSVVFDRRRKTWNLLTWENGKRRTHRLGTLAEYPSKSAARHAAQCIRFSISEVSKPTIIPTASVRKIVESYQAEKMPPRYSTSKAYKTWFKNYIVPAWGDGPITDLQPRPVELWLSSLQLSPKSRSHIRALLHVIWDYAMWSGSIPVQVNPISLVTVKGASKRTRHPRSLTVREFQAFIQNLREPFRTMALICVCLGLRISECLALKWADVDWLLGKLRVERGIVRQRVDDVKTVYSQQQMTLDSAMLDLLKHWKQATQFSGNEHWIFASPVKLGRQPWSYDQVQRMFLRAAEQAGIGRLGTHSMRHTYRSWLDATGTSVAVQQKLMRHADIRTTMNIYGNVVTDEMSKAHGKVVALALNGLQTDRRVT
jgi:integrase